MGEQVLGLLQGQLNEAKAREEHRIDIKDELELLEVWLVCRYFFVQFRRRSGERELTPIRCGPYQSRNGISILRSVCCFLLLLLLCIVGDALLLLSGML